MSILAVIGNIFYLINFTLCVPSIQDYPTLHVPSRFTFPHRTGYDATLRTRRKHTGTLMLFARPSLLTQLQPTDVISPLWKTQCFSQWNLFRVKSLKGCSRYGNLIFWNNLFHTNMHSFRLLFFKSIYTYIICKFLINNNLWKMIISHNQTSNFCCNPKY